MHRLMKGAISVTLSISRSASGGFFAERDGGMNVSKQGIVTVVGIDRIGIISAVSAALAEDKLNIVDIRQTVLNDFFTMIMVVDLSKSTQTIKQLQAKLGKLGEEQGLQITIQSEDIFRVMHRI
jgi:ACT domain-containing protein